MATITITTTLSQEAHKKAKDNGISWADAMSKGIGLILWEKDYGTSPFAKITKLADALQSATAQNQELLESNSRLRKDNNFLKEQVGTNGPKPQ